MNPQKNGLHERENKPVSSDDSSSSQTKVTLVKSCESKDNSPYTPVTGHDDCTNIQIRKGKCKIIENETRQPRIEKIGTGEKKNFWNIPRNKKNVIN